MAQASPGFVHPYIERSENRCGGSPVIAGTRFTVRSVVSYVLHQGLAPEDLAKEFTHLRPAQIHAALSCYYDHKQEIDRELEENSESHLMPEQA